MNDFIFLGSSEYAMRILKIMIECSVNRPFCLIDTDMSEAKKRYLLGHLSPYLEEDQLFDADWLQDPAFLASLARHGLNRGVRVNFARKLKKSFLSIFKQGVINLHPSFLPYNRGHWPEVWSILEETPAGVTLHFVDEELDTGDIIAQIKVAVTLEDTGETLCRKTEEAGIQLMQALWPEIIKNNISRNVQNEKHPLNRQNDLAKRLKIDLNESYTGMEFINRLRALTMPSFSLAPYFVDPSNGEKIWMTISLQREKPES